MPYITQDDRQEYNGATDELGLILDEHGYKPGHVTYVLFMILARWFKNDPCYNTIASIRGCLAGLLSELDRRYFFPYEDKKIKENGDVDLTFNTTVWEDAEPCGLGGCVMCPEGSLADKTLEAPELVDPDDLDTRGGA
jgi:hypothetical protein